MGLGLGLGLGLNKKEDWPIKLDAFNEIFRNGHEVKPSPGHSQEGYAVQYPDGYTSWSPKEVFKTAYFPMGEGNENKITQDMVDDFFGLAETKRLDEKTTLVSVAAVTGFVQHEISSCVDPANYDEEISCAIATKRIKDTLWKCLGFVLQWGVYGLKNKP